MKYVQNLKAQPNAGAKVGQNRSLHGVNEDFDRLLATPFLRVTGSAYLIEIYA